MTWKLSGELLLWDNIQLGKAGEVSVASGEALPTELRAAHWHLAPVPGGDYAVWTKSGMVGVERKRVDDLWASWRNTRLGGQLGIMLDSYDHVLLFIEDAPSISFSASLMLEPDGVTLMQDLVTFQERGIRVVFSSSLGGTHKLLEALVKRYNRSEHHALDRQGTQDKYIYRRMLLATPGWGGQAATEALRAIGPPIKVFTASPKELEAVNHVDKRKVHLLFGALGRAYGKIAARGNREKCPHKG